MERNNRHLDHPGQLPSSPIYTISSAASSGDENIADNNDSGVQQYQQPHDYHPRLKKKRRFERGAQSADLASAFTDKEANFLQRFNSTREAGSKTPTPKTPTRPPSAAEQFQSSHPGKRITAADIQTQAVGITDPRAPEITPRRSAQEYLEPIPDGRVLTFGQAPVPGSQTGGPLTAHPPFESMSHAADRASHRPSTTASPTVNQTDTVMTDSNRYTNESERMPASPTSGQNESTRQPSGFRQFMKQPSLKTLRQSFSSSRSSSTFVNQPAYGESAPTMRPTTPGGLSTYSTAAQSMAPSYGGKSTRTLKKKGSRWFNTGKRKSTFGMDGMGMGDGMEVDEGHLGAPGAGGHDAKRMKPSPSLPVLPEIEPTEKLDFDAEEFTPRE